MGQKNTGMRLNTVYSWLVLGMMAMATAPGISVADEAIPVAPLRLGDSPERDFQLTVHARKALMDTPNLSPLNVGIRVRRGVVSVWGPVPDKQTALMVVAKLEALKGVSGVQSELYVGSGGEGVQAFAIPPRRDTLQALATSPSISKGFPQPNVPEYQGTSRVLRMSPEGNGTGNPVPVSPGNPAKLTAMPDRQINSAPAPKTALPPTEAMIAELVRQQPKFGLMRYKLDGEVLVILGGGDPSRQMEFAQACSVIPGVGRVRLAQP